TKWKQMAEHLNLNNLEVESGPMYSNTSMGMQAAKHGQGVVVANRILAQNAIEEGSVIEAFTTDVYDEKAFYVVYPP
ncbi:transcriptional regulator, partial [Xanthomonas citri pv. citri]|nr:transcriptional regulator [Xanthomonas citri pv. citri]